MAISFGQLANRKLEAKVSVEIEDESGNVKQEPFRVIFRDYPSADHSRILDECRAEAERLQKQYEAESAEFEKKQSDYKAAMEVYNAAPDDNKPELPQNGFQPPSVPPSEQILYHAKVIEDLPDLRGDDGQSVPAPSVETFSRLGQNMNLCINAAIWKRRTEIDEKK